MRTHIRRKNHIDDGFRSSPWVTSTQAEYRGLIISALARSQYHRQQGFVHTIEVLYQYHDHLAMNKAKYFRYSIHYGKDL